MRAALAVTAPHLLTAAVVLLIGLPTVILPFWSDTGIFALMGKTIWEGGLPYVDAWDQKPPGIYLIYAFAIHGPFGLIGNVRVFDLGWTAATVVVLVELGRRWWSVRAGVIAGLSYGVVYLTASTWTQLAQPDSFIGLPLVLALLAQDVGRGRRWSLVAVGLLLGCAFQLRAISALLIPFFPLAMPPRTPAASPRNAWLRAMILIGIGFALAQGAFAAYLLAGGAFGEFILATRFATGYTRLGGPWQGPDGPTTASYLNALRLSFLHWALVRIVLTVPAALAAFSGTFLRRERRVIVLSLFCLLGYTGIAMQAKFFWYHFLYLVPFFALLAGWGWDQLLVRLRRTMGRTPAYATGLVLAILFCLWTPDVSDNGWYQWRSFLRYRADPEWRQAYFAYFGGYDETRETADYLQRNTAPGEAFYIWGYDPLIYLLADRPHAQRFIYSFPMMSAWAPPAWTEEFVAAMRAKPPRYFVTQHNQGGPWIVGHEIDPAYYVPSIPALNEWLHENYTMETQIESYVIYRRLW